jgi:hypothetical protein
VNHSSDLGDLGRADESRVFEVDNSEFSEQKECQWWRANRHHPEEWLWKLDALKISTDPNADIGNCDAFGSGKQCNRLYPTIAFTSQISLLG